MAAARPRLCPRCGNLVGSEDDRCYACGLRLGTAGHGLATVRRLFRKHASTSGILAVSFGLVFLGMVAMQGALFVPESGTGLRRLLGGFSAETLVRCGAQLPYCIGEQGEVWRLVTAMFLHGGLLHLLFNTYVLLQLGRLCALYFDARRTYVIFFVSGVAGFAGSFLAGKFSVGASGAILGLAGAILARARLSGGAVDRVIYGQLLRWVVLIVVLGFLLSGVIDWVAHLVGLVAGAGIGALLIRERAPLHALFFWGSVLLTLGAVTMGLVYCLSWPPAYLGG
ncbi:MAG: rhomboid family intramembrane serine protease [Planctomycetes bacterium]|nr:rhomboid family intramembrane serine protease [Planctomycetota bacterium]